MTFSCITAKKGQHVVITRSQHYKDICIITWVHSTKSASALHSRHLMLNPGPMNFEGVTMDCVWRECKQIWENMEINNTGSVMQWMDVKQTTADEYKVQNSWFSFIFQHKFCATEIIFFAVPNPISLYIKQGSSNLSYNGENATNTPSLEFEKN